MQERDKGVAGEMKGSDRRVTSLIKFPFFNPNKPGVFSKQFILGGRGQLSSLLKSAVSAIFLYTKQQKTFQGTLGTQDLTPIWSKTSLGPSMDPTGPLKWTLWFLRKISEFLRKFRNFYFLYSLALLTMLEDLFGHCPTLPRLKGPSWTFIDPKMDSQTDPGRLISGDPW